MTHLNETGNYSCVANNEAGNDTKDLPVTIVGKIYFPVGTTMKLFGFWKPSLSFPLRKMNKIGAIKSMPKREPDRGCGDAAQITDFTQTWHNCWAWWINDYGENCIGQNILIPLNKGEPLQVKMAI